MEIINPHSNYAMTFSILGLYFTEIGSILIFLFTTLNEWKSFKGYDRLIQTQTTENYFITNNQLKE